MPSLVNLQALLGGGGNARASRMSAALLVESGGIRTSRGKILIEDPLDRKSVV